MADLDLSFAITGEAAKNYKPAPPVEQEQPKAKNDTGLDLSFAVTGPAAKALKLQEEPKDERPFWQRWGSKAKNLVTGADRETKATEELPEMSATGVGKLLGPNASAAQKAAASAALLTTFDPVEQLEIIKANTPDPVSEFTDEKGNYGVNVGGRIVMLNKPGMSGTDAAQMVGVGSLFTPAGKMGVGAATGMQAAARVGLASAGTQGVISAGQQLAGREMDGSEVAGEMAISGALGAAGERLTRLIPWAKQKLKGQPVTPELSAAIRAEATKVGLDPGAVDDVIRQITDQADNAVSPGQAMALQGEKEFAIPLTQGQRTSAPKQLSLEDRMRSAMVGGEKAQSVMLGFENQVQKPAIEAAQQKLKQAVAGTAPMVSSRAEAGGLLKEGILRAEQQADDAVRQAYANVGDASLTPEGFRNLLRSTKAAIRGDTFVKSPQLAPATDDLLKTISKAEATMAKIEKSAGARLKPVTLNRIEELRKVLNQYASAAANPADKRNVLTMKQAFDDYLDDAVQKALFTGDDAALESLKQARGTFSEYAKKFRAQDVRTDGGKLATDQPGRFIEKLVAANPTDEEVVNSLFGASGFSNKSGADMAQRFKSILGPDSDEWGVVRQEAFRRLLKTQKTASGEIVSGQQTLKAIDDALDKNSSLMKELFTSQEISKIRRFAAQVRRTQPTPAEINASRGNPSGSAVQAARTISDLFGYGSGNLPFIATTKGLEIVKGLSNVAKAKNAVRPFERFAATRPTVVGGAVAAGQSEIQ